MDTIDYTKLEYGPYILEYDTEDRFNENFRYHMAEFDKLYIRRLRLPDGKGNIVYFLTDSFRSSMKILNNNNFVIPVTYKKYFYPWIGYGSFLRRRYRFNVIKERNDRVAEIKENSKLVLYPSKKLVKSRENIIFDLSDIYQAIKPTIERTPVTRLMAEFYKEFDKVIKLYTPEISTETDDKSFNNRIILLDADSFKFNIAGKLSENKNNPLFLIYLVFLRTRNLSLLDVDMDMLIVSKNVFMKFNPVKTTPNKWNIFKRALFRIMNTNLDEYTDTLSSEEKTEIEDTGKAQLITNIVKDTIKPFIKNISPSTSSVLSDAISDTIRSSAESSAKINRIIKRDQKIISKSINGKVDDNLFQKVINDKGKSIVNTSPYAGISDKKQSLLNALSKEEVSLNSNDKRIIKSYAPEIKDDVMALIKDDKKVIEEVDNAIQDNVAPMDNVKTAPVVSPRDKKIREKHKNLVLKNSTVGEILAKDTTNIPIKVDNKSSVLTTSNENVANIKFANFEKTYLEELFVKDILSAFDSLKDKSTPFYITNISVKDTSTNMDLKETWSVQLTDETKKRHTIRVDIPKFYQDRFMLIGGNKWMILKQNFYNPLVKDTNDEVILTTNFNKVTVRRKATKSLATVEKIFTLAKYTASDSIFITGDASIGNRKYVSSLEYDELSRRILKFSSGKCELIFSREYIENNMKDKIPDQILGTEFFIGMEDKNPIIINEDTGRDRNNRTISEIIEANLSEEHKAIFNSIKPKRQLMFAENKLAGQWIPVIVTLIIWIGISKALDAMDMVWTFHKGRKRLYHHPNFNYVKFSNGTLEYENSLHAELIFNGLYKIDNEHTTFESLDNGSGCDDYMKSVWGNYNGITQVKNFHEFLIDPITENVCKDLRLPTTPEGLLIHAVKLLMDNSCNSKASDNSYRVRSIEVIPSILYSCIATEYLNYVKQGRKTPLSIKQRDVIDKLIDLKTVEEYSTLNPAVEVSKTHLISTKGYRGSNSEYSYDQEKRSYDPSAIGKLSLTTSPDGNVGVSKNLVVEPTLTNARGYREPVDDINALKDVNIFAPIELLTPGSIRYDDAIRNCMANKQTQHLVPVDGAYPSLISNGFDEAVQFHLSSDFVVNAAEDGKVVEINEEVGFIVVEYESGNSQAINIKPEIVKNSNNGFYLANTLKPTVTKVGQKFKKDEVLAYHDKYFKHSKLNGLRHAIGPISKVAIMSTYNTYEDAGICTNTLANKMRTSIVYPEAATFKKNTNILKIAKIGDTVNIGDSLIKYDSSFEDNELSKYLTKLSEENKAIIEEETRNEIKAHHAGTIVDIKVYSLHHPSNLSPSLGKVVQQYFDKGNNKKKLLSKYDNSEGILKAGYLLIDSTEPVITRYNTIKNYKGIDVLIEFYIEHSDVVGVGDKICLYSANKQIVSEVIPEGYEPYSEFRPDEEISVLSSPGTIARRMTSSTLVIAAIMKIMIELKRKIKDIIKYK
jgi:hypothetical protein